MERQKEKRYSTGEFAKHFGIKKDTLFYYDKIGLFRPAQIAANGYRCYTSAQIDTFWALLSLRELGVSVEHLQKYFQNPNPEHLLALAASQQVVVEKEIKKLKKVNSLLNRIMLHTREGLESSLNTVEIENEESKRLIFSEYFTKNAETTHDEWIKIYDNFLIDIKELNGTYIGSVISQKNIKQGRYGYVERLFVEVKEKTDYIRESGKYATYYHKGNYESIIGIYPDLLNQIDKRGYCIDSDAYEEYIISNLATNRQDEFITKISIKVVKKTY